LVVVVVKSASAQFPYIRVSVESEAIRQISGLGVMEHDSPSTPGSGNKQDAFDRHARAKKECEYAAAWSTPLSFGIATLSSAAKP
jgi:hypothetical protein